MCCRIAHNEMELLYRTGLDYGNADGMLSLMACGSYV